MKDIKIFVSRRLDIDSVAIPNPLYQSVVCGAFREHSPSPYAGDDTGDNISIKQPFYSELTVQYWAWKNQQADYYGLCHYRRFLSFSKKKLRTNERNMVSEPILSIKSIKRHCLDDNDYMQKLITQYDAVVPEGADVNRLASPNGGLSKTVRGLWEGHDGFLIKKQDLEFLTESISALYPQYLESALDYLDGTVHIGYNCYVLRKDFFLELCRFQFNVLADLECKIDAKSYKGNLKRVFGYMGEIMFGIYIHELERRKTVSIKKLKLVYFEETRKPYNILHKIWLVFLAYITFAFHHSSEIILPKGSIKRERIKGLMARLRGFSKERSGK